MSILKIIGLTLLVVICLIIIFLYLGVKISIKYEKIGSKLTASVEILFLEKIVIVTKKYPSSEDKNNEKDSSINIKGLFPYIKKALPYLVDFLKKSLKSLHFRKFQNHLVLGLSNYADTAKYIGYIWAIFTIPNSLIKSCLLTAEPTFTNEKIDLKGEIDVKINILTLIIPLLKLIIKKDVRNLIKEVRNERKY